MASKEGSVALHQLSDATVRSGRCPEQSLTQVAPGGSKVKSEAMEKVDPSPVLEVPAIYIKEEPENETEEVSIKEEPFLDGNEASSNQHLPGVPCKTEAKVETHDPHPNSSQNTSALLLNQ
ncbi:uncharacterized protein LOC125179289, partial [Hyalella azteca]|uniref:Uncharacterized protein LOC125179289 n=1 Tax=Hyalella azteca TaxID=294128 RepID=A0A979FXH4_HYAAZ